ncbi:MAG: hypothetical protein ACREAA_06045 [Candidatus Polarisedimenticolia bacterium]
MKRSEPMLIGDAGAAGVDIAAAISMPRARESMRLVATLPDSSMSGRAARSGAEARSIEPPHRGQRLREAFTPAGTLRRTPHAPQQTVVVWVACEPGEVAGALVEV